MKKLLTMAMLLMSVVTMKAQQKADFNVVPVPQVLNVNASGQTLRLSDVKLIDCKGDEAMLRNALFLNDYLRDITGGQLPLGTAGKKDVAVRLVLDQKVTGSEAYSISVDKQGITIAGSTPQGVFYGIQTLRKALPQAAFSQIEVPFATVGGSPRFGYRGMHLDVCRHFFGKETVKKYIDMMTLHGMNTLHWHLSDDQGWRIEIKKWPRLTTIGSTRPHTIVGRNVGLYDDTPVSGYFTQADIREIVEYARQRYVTIIPEIDMPGHMLAALAAYPELGCTGGPYEVCPDWGVFDDILCGGNPRIYDFLRDVLDEVMALFPSEIIHMGGDEAPKTRWKDCPRCQQKIRELGITATDKHTAEDQLQGHIVREMEKYLRQHDRRLLGWDEILDCNVDESAMVMNWRDFSGGGRDGSQMGHDVIQTPNSTLYFDFYQTSEKEWSHPLLIGGFSPLDKVYAYEPAPATLSDEARRHIVGVQANLWTEYIYCESLLEYQVLPRMAALSEVQWLEPEQKNFEAFTQRLPRLTSLYEAQGWHYCKANLK